MQLLEHPLRRCGVGLAQLLEETQLHGERNEPLLGAIVKIALDSTPLRVGRGDDPRARRAQLVRLATELVQRCLKRRVQADVSQRDSHLSGELGEDVIVVVAERLGTWGPLGDEQSQQLAPVGDRSHAHRAPLALREKFGKPDFDPGVSGHTRAGDDG